MPEEFEFYVVGSSVKKAILLLEETELYNTQKEAQEDLEAYQLQYMRRKDFKIYKVKVEECPS